MTGLAVVLILGLWGLTCGPFGRVLVSAGEGRGVKKDIVAGPGLEDANVPSFLCAPFGRRFLYH